MKKIELCKGLSLQRGDDGHWLTFKSGGKEASFNIENLVEGKHIIKSAVIGWVNEQFEPSMKYKVGDTVLIKTTKQLKEDYRNISTLEYIHKPLWKTLEGNQLKIEQIEYPYYIFRTGLTTHHYIEEPYIERLVEPKELKSIEYGVSEEFGNCDKLISEYEKATKAKKPPLGIAPRKLYEEMANTARINDLWEALHRYVVEGCKIPPEWIDELKERYKMVEES